MTWYCDGFGGGETRDALIEGCSGDPGANPQPILNAGWDIITSPVKNGTGAIRIPAGVAGSRSLLPNTMDGRHILCLQTWINYDGNPEAAYYAMGVRDAGAHMGYLLLVGTDRRVCLYKETPGHYSQITAWSAGVLGNSAFTHLVWFLDPLTLGTHHVWMTVIIDDVVQIQADVGVWPATLDGGLTDGAYLWGSAAVNVDIRLDDIAGLYSSDADDAPHITAAPIVKVAAQHPNSDSGCSLEWIRNGGTSDYYTYWDEPTGNDGDTTYLRGGQNVLQTSLFEDADTLGWGAGATVLEYSAGIGPVWSAIYKSIASGTKWAYKTYCTNPAATEVPLVDPGTSYAGVLKRLARTSGSWARADLGTLKAGGLGGWWVDRPCAITTLMLQWAYYDTTLSLTPAPMIPQGQIF